ncbi:3D domain-containing protein [Evansella sp. AB-rgal1]|uniref:PcsB-like coiled-coil domain-containing protein n=1 Tax=Evansella sp. AB-rgal1 TaxID=3242696 RepID=UPI00359E21B5
MLKKFMIFIILIGLTSLFVAGEVLATEALEEDQERLQQEREAVQSELSDAKDSLVELAQKLEQLNSQLSDLQNEIELNENHIMETEENIAVNGLAIEKLQADIELLQSDLDKRVELLKGRASSYQKNGIDSASYIRVILGADSFSDFVSRVFTISKIAQADNYFITQLENSQQELAEAQGKYEEIMYELVNQVVELENVRANIGEKQAKTKMLRDEMKENEKKQEVLISQLTDKEKDIASQQEEIRKEIAEQVRLQEEARAKAEREARARAQQEAAKQSVSRSSSSGGQSNSTTSSQQAGSWRTFTATAYTAYCTGCSGVTSTGINLRSNPNAKVIAVDPNVIPLGSRVEVQGYGTFLAADTGGAINGNIIDIFMPNRNDALAFGRRTVQIRVLH